ncbi:amidohydrolase family protein [Nocardioides bruguierae]|uniref:Amidohydrolase family protein n=1 Tax=Nocardioides bruguierae TaxID=2945102 RepID=A0A9X2IEM5_9ACTN|nr:amidohydrolase family protein [Nocardioides bruguierae]MCM0619509.1 amidohydrolase family protein [Nocardioides bruguierae]
MSPTGSQGPVRGDAHMHLFSRGYHPERASEQSDLERYEAFRAGHGVAAALVIGYVGDGIDPGNNAYLRSLAVDRPWMTTLAHVVATPTAAEVSRLLADGHRGVSVLCRTEQDAAWLAAWPDEVWQVLEDAAAMVSINGAPPAHPGLAAVVRARPGCTFLFAHLGEPGSYASVPTHDQARARLAGLLALGGEANAYVKASGFYQTSTALDAGSTAHAQARPFVDVLLEAFGPRHLVWGSDFSPVADFTDLDTAASPGALAGLDLADRAAVMGGTLLGLLGA